MTVGDGNSLIICKICTIGRELRILSGHTGQVPGMTKVEDVSLTYYYLFLKRKYNPSYMLRTLPFTLSQGYFCLALAKAHCILQFL
jgi:hypothetical protein